MADINPFFTRDDSTQVMGTPRGEQKINPFFSREGNGEGLPTLKLEDVMVDTQQPLPEPTEEELAEESRQPVGTTDFDDAARFIRDTDGFTGVADIQFELLNIADPDARVNEKYLDGNIEELLPPEVSAEAIADVTEPTPEPPVKDDLEATEPTVELTFDERLTTLLDAEYDRIEEDEKFQQVIEAEAQELVDIYNSFVPSIQKRVKAGVITQEEADRRIAEEMKRFKGQQGLGIATVASNMEEARELVRNKYYDRANKLKAKTLARLENRNVMTRSLSSILLDQVEEGNLSLDQLNLAVGLDEWFSPATTAVEIPHNFADMQENVRDGNLKGAAIDAGIGVLNVVASIPLARLATKSISSGWKALSGGRGAYHDVQEALARETDRAIEVRKLATETANKNKDIRNQLIREFEERFSVTISQADEAGDLTVDPQLVRDTGKKKVSEYYSDMGYVGNDGKTVKLTDYAINDDSLAIPILDPEKMDMFVATVAGLKNNPEFAKALQTTGDERLVDKLFDLTLNKELLGSEELLSELTKNGLSFEEYVLGVVGSGSQAGQLLNQLSQMKRYKPASVKEAQEVRAKIETQKALGKLWASTVLRPENIRRGIMVSSLATAARNLQSAGIRAPMESLADVMDTAIITYGKARTSGKTRADAVADFASSINPLVRDGTWSGAFNNMRYMFMEQGRAEEFTNYILDRPELAEQFERMFNNINEIQEYTGRGQAQTLVGKGADNVASRVEDFVWAVNGPNRWQEHMVRRATFLGELERQVKLNWDMDLQTALKEGKIQDMLNDASNVRPEGGTSFLTMVETATNKALDVTYAKQPDFAPFKATSEAITKTGLTVVVPFPRFMFNSMEYMAQNAGGTLLVPIRKAVSKESRAAGITARDRQDITRNLVGIATMASYYQVRKEFGTEDYTSVTYEDQQVDLSAQYPMRQIGWVVEFERRRQEGTLETWYGMDMEEITETWLGTNARTGTGNVFLEEIMEGIRGTEDIIDEEKRSKAIGRFVGQYANTFLTPIFQMAEAQRIQGIRGEEAKDFKGSITREANLPYAGESAFVRSFYEQIAQRGLAAPSFEEELPQRVSIDQGKVQRPDSGARLYAGLTIRERDSDVREYLREIGYSDATYQLGSKSRIPENKIAENEFISNVFPTMVNLAQQIAEDRGKTKKEQHIIARKFIKEAATDLRDEFNDPALGGASQLAIVADQLGRLSKEDRAYGIQMFKSYNEGRLPDITSLQNLNAVLEYSKMSFLK